MAEVFSLLAAGVQVAQFMVEAAKTIHGFVKDGQSTPEDLVIFGKELKLFADVLIFFDQNTRTLSERVSGLQKDKTDAVQNAVDLSQSAEKGCKVLMKRFDMENNKKPSLFKTIRNQLIWTQKKTQVTFLRLNLHNARSSVSSLTMQFALEYAMLTHQPQEMIQTLETQDTNARREAREARHEIRHYVKAHHREMEPLCVEIYKTTEVTTKEIDRHRVRMKRVRREERIFHYEMQRGDEATRLPHTTGYPSATTAARELASATPSTSRLRSEGRMSRAASIQSSQQTAKKTRNIEVEANEDAKPDQLQLVHLPLVHRGREHFRGTRIRDDGSGIVEEEGWWPSDVEVDFTEGKHPMNLPTHAKNGNGTPDEDRSPPKPKHSPQPDDQEEDAPKGPGEGSSLMTSTGQGSSSSINVSNPGPWRAAPPFGGPDGRKRPRRRRRPERRASRASDH